MRILVTADVSGGAMSVLEGTFTFRSGGRVERVPAGGRLQLPRGARHVFANESDAPARAITVLVPGGLEKFLRAAVGPDRPKDAASARELERKHGLDFTPGDV